MHRYFVNSHKVSVLKITILLLITYYLTKTMLKLKAT